MGQRSDELSDHLAGRDEGEGGQDVAWRPVEESTVPVDRLIFDSGTGPGTVLETSPSERMADAAAQPVRGAVPPAAPVMDGPEAEAPEITEQDPIADDPAVTEQLAEIAQTRDEMRQTLEAIGEKLNPQTVIEEAKETVREAAAGVLESAKETVRAATIGKVEDAVGATGERVGEAMSAVGESVEAAVAPAMEVGSNFVETVRANPLPAAMVALGTGWLLIKRPPRRRARRARPLPTAQRGPSAWGPTPGTPLRGSSTATYRRNDMAGNQYRMAPSQAATYQRYGATYSAEQAHRPGNAGDVAGGLLQTVQRHPLPTALAGLGLAWLYMNRGAQDHSSYDDMAAPYGSDSTYAYGQQSGGVSDALHQAQRTAGTVVEQVGDRVGDVVQGAQQAAGSVGDAANRVVQGTQQTVGQAAESVGETAGDLGSALITTIRQNPLPAALAGLSLGWLYLSAREQTARGGAQSVNHAYDRYGYRSYGGAIDNPYGQPERHGEGVTGAIGDRVGTVVQGTQEAVSQAAGQVGDTVGQVVQGAQQAVGQAADAVGGTAAQVAGGAQQTVQTATSGMGTMLQDNPLVVGVLATGLGIAVGLSLPATEPENQFLGPAKEALTTKAGEAAQETVQKVQSVAHEALGSAKKEARQQEILPNA